MRIVVAVALAVALVGCGSPQDSETEPTEECVDLGAHDAWTYVYATSGELLYLVLEPGASLCLERNRDELCIYQGGPPREDNALGEDAVASPENATVCAPTAAPEGER